MAAEQELNVREEVGGVIYNIEIEASGGEAGSVDIDRIDDLPGMLLDLGAVDAVGSFGGVVNGPGASLGLDADIPEDAMRRGIEWFLTACDKLGIDHGGIERIVVSTEDYLDRVADQEPETYVGMAEIAGILKVSKQRVYELRRSTALPAPIAELAAGPVWTRSSLKRFVESWERKPGRPRKRNVARSA
jgi:hypothetical protein